MKKSYVGQVVAHLGPPPAGVEQFEAFLAVAQICIVNKHMYIQINKQTNRKLVHYSKMIGTELLCPN